MVAPHSVVTPPVAGPQGMIVYQNMVGGVSPMLGAGFGLPEAKGPHGPMDPRFLQPSAADFTPYAIQSHSASTAPAIAAGRGPPLTAASAPPTPGLGDLPSGSAAARQRDIAWKDARRRGGGRSHGQPGGRSGGRAIGAAAPTVALRLLAAPFPGATQAAPELEAPASCKDPAGLNPSSYGVPPELCVRNTFLHDPRHRSLSLDPDFEERQIKSSPPSGPPSGRLEIASPEPATSGVRPPLEISVMDDAYCTDTDTNELQSPFALATPTSSTRDDVVYTPRAEAVELTPATAASWPFPVTYNQPSVPYNVATGQGQQQQSSTPCPQTPAMTCILPPYQQHFPPPVLRLSEALAQPSPAPDLLFRAQYAASITADGSSIGGSASWPASSVGSAEVPVASSGPPSTRAAVGAAEKTDFDRPALGSAALPSRGSALHRWGACKPCAFIYQEGCQNGVDCQFCHLCDPGERKRRKKERLTSKRDAREETRRHRQEVAAGRGSHKR